MKNTIVITLIVFAVNSIMLISQTHRIYVGAGYNLPTATAVVGKTHTFEEHKIRTGGYAKGFNVQAGYRINLINNLYADVNAEYLLGVSDEIYHNSVDADFGEYRSYGIVKSFTTSKIKITPSILMAFNTGAFEPYIKFGGSINFIDLTEKWILDAEQHTDKYDYEGSFSLGWFGGIGTNYNLDIVMVFIEFQLNMLTYYPDKVKIVKTYPDRMEENTYELVENVNNDTPPGSKLAVDFPYSSISIIGGIKINL